MRPAQVMAEVDGFYGARLGAGTVGVVDLREHASEAGAA